MHRRLLAYKKLDATSTPIPHTDLLGAFAFHNIGGWTNAIVKVRRDSDDATAYVFSDPSDDIGEISLSSPISTSSDTTSSATLLSAWKGSDVLTIEEWYFQQTSNVIDTDANLTTVTLARQPELADSSGLYTKNSRVCVDWTSSQTSLWSDGFGGVSMSDNFSVFVVDATTGSEDLAWCFRVYHPGSSYFAIVNDNRSNKRNTLLRTDGSATVYGADNLLVNNTNNLKLLTGIKNATDIISYYNGVIQTTVAHDGDDYDSSRVVLGAFSDTSGNYEHVTSAVYVYSEDVTSNITNINDDIDNIFGF